MKRREFLKSSSALAGSPLAFGGLGNTLTASGTFSPTVRAASGLSGMRHANQFIIAGANNDPEWHVYYTKEDGEDRRDSLIAWVDSNSSRRVVSENRDRGRMTIRASVTDVGATFMDSILNRGLQSREWVESIDVSMKAGVPEPVETVIAASEFSMNYSIMEHIQARAGSYQPTGLAFDEDASAAGMDEIVEAIGGESR